MKQHKFKENCGQKKIKQQHIVNGVTNPLKTLTRITTSVNPTQTKSRTIKIKTHHTHHPIFYI